MKALKFGGTSLGSKKALENVIKIIQDSFTKQGPLIVIVSAVGGVTNLLINVANEAVAVGQVNHQELQSKHLEVFSHEMPDVSELDSILKGIALLRDCTVRTLDFVTSFGERASAQLLAGILLERSIPASYVDARTLIVTDGRFGAANILPQTDTNIAAWGKKLEPQIYVVTGFIGATADGVTTTLGRGGSDYSATIFGAALAAESVEIWTDVNGVMSADPRLVKEAFVLPHISYEEAVELAHWGAKIIHPKTLLPVVELGIPVFIKNTFVPEQPGTKISVKTSSQQAVTGIASFNGISVINFSGVGLIGVPKIAGRLFTALGNSQVNIIAISQASSEYSICFVILSKDVDIAQAAIIYEFDNEIKAGFLNQPQINNSLAVVAVVGEGMSGKPGVAALILGALAKNNISVYELRNSKFLKELI